MTKRVLPIGILLGVLGAALVISAISVSAVAAQQQSQQQREAQSACAVLRNPSSPGAGYASLCVSRGQFEAESSAGGSTELVGTFLSLFLISPGRFQHFCGPINDGDFAPGLDSARLVTTVGPSSRPVCLVFNSSDASMNVAGQADLAALAAGAEALASNVTLDLTWTRDNPFNEISGSGQRQTSCAAASSSSSSEVSTTFALATAEGSITGLGAVRSAGGRFRAELRSSRFAFSVSFEGVPAPGCFLR